MCRSFILIVFSIFISSAALAQTQENSPYSRFGLGNFADPFFAAQGSMGGWSAGFTDPYLLNFNNPASLASLQATTFDVGMYGKFTNLRDNNNSIDQWGGNLSYFGLAFPIKNPLNDFLSRKQRKFFWGAGLSLAPFSTVSYNIATTEYQQDLGKISRIYDGNGGTYQLQIGNGFKYNDFSVGANLGWWFGKLRKNQSVYLSDYNNSFYDRIEESQAIGGFLWKAGAQYTIWLKRPVETEVKKVKRYITLGLSGSNQTGYNTELDRLHLIVNPTTRVLDTISSIRGETLRGKLPGTFAIGAAYNDEGKIRAGLDLNLTSWNQFNNPVDAQVFRNTWSVNAGLEYIPDATSISKFLKRVRYRGGVRIGTDPRVFGEQLKTFEVNAGVGLPFVVSREISFMHIGFTYGSIYGNIPLKENYFRFNLGFSFVDNTWFVKRRFY